MVLEFSCLVLDNISKLIYLQTWKAEYLSYENSDKAIKIVLLD
jgi:hypothetical protein